MQTDRILLRRWEETDAEALYKYASGRVMEKCGFVETGMLAGLEKLEVGSDKPVRVMKLDARYSPMHRKIKIE